MAWTENPPASVTWTEEVEGPFDLDLFDPAIFDTNDNPVWTQETATSTTWT